jgi:hypothetical protein
MIRFAAKVNYSAWFSAIPVSTIRRAACREETVFAITTRVSKGSAQNPKIPVLT